MMLAVFETVEIVHHVSFRPIVAALRLIVRFGPDFTFFPPSTDYAVVHYELILCLSSSEKICPVAC